MIKLRIVWMAAALAGMGLFSSGCETPNHFVRKSHPDEKAANYVPAEDGDGEAKAAAGPKGFFKGGRLPGAMSSEGAEIERSLGVYKE